MKIMNWDKALKPEKVRKLVYEIFADGPPREHKKLSLFKGDTFVKKKRKGDTFVRDVWYWKGTCIGS